MSLGKYFHLTLNLNLQQKMHPTRNAVFNKIHIFNGRDNNSHYLIYDPETNEVIDHTINQHIIRGAQTLLYQSRIVRMGGYDRTSRQFSDRFQMSAKIQKIQVNNVPNFKIIHRWKLPLTLSRFAYNNILNYVK